MAWTRPPLSQLIAESQGDIQSRFNKAGAPLPRSVLTIFATVFANGFDALTGQIAAVSKNILPDSSEDAIVLRQASLRGLSLKLAASAAGNAIFTGTIGGTVPAGTLIQRADQAQFITTAAGTIVAGTTVTVPVTAVLAGAAGNTPANAPVTLGASITNIQTNAAIDANGLTGGADVEQIESLRARVIAYDEEEATGGNLSDYVAWAKQRPGVTRAWSYKNWSGAGTVGLTFVLDGNASIIPAAGDLAAMQSFIDSVAPATATNVIFAPTAVPMNPTIHLVGADTPAIRTAVTAELAAMIASGVQPDGSLGTQPGGTTYLNSQILPAIAAAPGVVSFTVTLLAGAAPADLAMPAGSILTLGNVTFV